MEFNRSFQGPFLSHAPEALTPEVSQGAQAGHMQEGPPVPT